MSRPQIAHCIQVVNAALEIGREQRLRGCNGFRFDLSFNGGGHRLLNNGGRNFFDRHGLGHARLRRQGGRTSSHGLLEHRRRRWRCDGRCAGHNFGFERLLDDFDLVEVYAAELATDFVEARIGADFQQDTGVNVQVLGELINADLGFLRRRQASPLLFLRSSHMPVSRGMAVAIVKQTFAYF
jgi:hypothetical protein